MQLAFHVQLAVAAAEFAVPAQLSAEAGVNKKSDEVILQRERFNDANLA